jgi:MFS family permease
MNDVAPLSPANSGLSRRLKLLLALLLTGQFMAVLDASIVNVAIPTIRLDLSATGADLQLIVAGYVIAYAVLLITGARLGMRFGFRRGALPCSPSRRLRVVSHPPAGRSSWSGRSRAAARR